MGSNIVIFALMNINVILLLFLLYLIARNVVKLIFERKQNIFGHRLRTKLVITFIALSLIPTIVLFGLATQFISTSMEYWYNIQVEQSLKKSLEVAQSLYQKAIDSGFIVNTQLVELISRHGMLNKDKGKQLAELMQEARRAHNLHQIAVYLPDLQLMASDPKAESSSIIRTLVLGISGSGDVAVQVSVLGNTVINSVTAGIENSTVTAGGDVSLSASDIAPSLIPDWLIPEEWSAATSEALTDSPGNGRKYCFRHDQRGRFRCCCCKHSIFRECDSELGHSRYNRI